MSIIFIGPSAYLTNNSMLGLISQINITTYTECFKILFLILLKSASFHLLQFVSKHRSEINSYDTRIKDRFDTNKTRTRLADSSIRQVIPRLTSINYN